MAKFIAAEAVEALDWDFSSVIKDGETTGTTPEPSTGRINEYRKMIKVLAMDVREFRGQNDLEDVDPEDMDVDEALDTLESMDEQMAVAEGFQRRTMESLAFLCGADWVEEANADLEGPTLVGGSPSLEVLEKVPYRVLQAFSQWIMGELAPKQDRESTRPTPTDFKRSRKVAKKSSTSRRATSKKG